MPAEPTYLGDGAYAEFRDTMLDVRVYASNGIEVTNEVYLGPHEFEALLRFVKGQPRFMDAIRRAMA